MPDITIIRDGIERTVTFAGSVLLRDVLAEHGYLIPHPCGGRGTCKKCTVTANGVPVLSCRHTVSEDTVVILPRDEELCVTTGADESGVLTEKNCLCFDIGTTTLALALVSLSDKSVVRTVTAANPQRAYGADVVSRIDHCMKNGVSAVSGVLLEKTGEMVCELLGEFGISSVERTYVSGNTTMLHLFAGIDPSSMGTAPYTPSFIGEMRLDGGQLGIPELGEVVLLPGISAFVGADIVSGIGCVGTPSEGRYRLLMDLGTNAELALFSRERILCTAAAAGPCFEGANISCGMSASEGAVCEVYPNGLCRVIGGIEPRGLCATGLVDAVAYGIRRGDIDESGYLEDDLQLCGPVRLTMRDVREFQLAKSAIRAATECLVRRAGIDYSDIEGLYVAGGFSASLNAGNAAFVGLIPQELSTKMIGVNNGSLLGLVRLATEGREVLPDLTEASYEELTRDGTFTELFMEYMSF